MSKKKPKLSRAETPATTRQRVEKALREQRAQHALQLARELYKQQPTAEYRDLLKQASLARGRELAQQGKHTDAAEVFLHAAQLAPEPAILVEAARALAATGQLTRALALREQITDESLKQRLLAFIADEAVHQGPAAAKQLPEDLRPAVDLVIKAFSEAEAGQDDAARATLQGIGLRSPLLEWKLLLRGLLAYYHNDDTRALENWQRLDPERWPFRLVAPLRFTIDPAFAVQQPPATQTVLQQQADRLGGTPLIPQLRSVQALMNNERQLANAFRTAESLLPVLKTMLPDQVPRLASCFYWAVIHHGQPEDMKRYQRVFGKPPDDPDLSRLEALALEERGQMDGAHHFWQQFDKTVEHNSFWPAEQRSRVRAMIWQRMGDNADAVPELPDDSLLPPFLRNHPDRPKPLKPGPEKCYEKSLQLAPDRLETHQALLDHFLKTEDNAKAEAAARRLLQHFPDHALTLEQLGDVLMKEEKYAEALHFFQQALNANPLEIRLRQKVSSAYAYHARGLAEQGQYEESRTAYQAALAMNDRRNPYAVLCKWAACEYKAGNNARGEELLQQAQSEQGTRLAVVFSLLIETIRFKLTKLKPKVNKEFNALLAEPPTGTAAAALASTVASLKQAGVKYHGQQTHEKKVLDYLDKAREKADFTEEELKAICAALLLLKKQKLLGDYIQLAQQRYPNNPFFFLAEVQFEVEQGPYRFNGWRARQALERARELATALPRGEEQQKLLQQVQQLEQALLLLNPFAGLLGGGMLDMLPLDEIFGGDDEDDDGF